jgi:4-hydroxybenzoate polyprenyltransferase
MSTVRHYLSLVKFSHTIFALPFAIIGFFLGVDALAREQGQSWLDVKSLSFWGWKGLLVLICMVTARSAAMAFNRYLDRRFDAKNPRTAIREIPAGIIAAESALRFVIGNAVVFMIATRFINPICFYLSPVALFVILFYSYTKRFTALCHLVLGLGLSLAPIGAFLAVTGYFAWLPIFFSLAVLTWVSGFDIIYALQDEQFDRSHQLHSIPVALGTVKALRVSEILHVFSAAALATAGWWGGMGVLFWVGWVGFSGMLIYQHVLVKPHDLSRVNLAFMTANGIASVVFALCVLGDLLWA